MNKIIILKVVVFVKIILVWWINLISRNVFLVIKENNFVNVNIFLIIRENLLIYRANVVNDLHQIDLKDLFIEIYNEEMRILSIIIEAVITKIIMSHFIELIKKVRRIERLVADLVMDN